VHGSALLWYKLDCLVCANLCKVTKTQLVLQCLAKFDAESMHVIPIFPLMAAEGEWSKYTQAGQ
jgi:hypothetical protein